MKPSERDEAVAETVAAAPTPDATVASTPSPPPRASGVTLLPVGTHVGRYELAERLGVGGMGVVYRARDPKLDRDVAIKLVTASDAAAAHEYLEREAQAMAKLSHPNVAAVFDIGTWNGQVFIAMELCTRGSLARWLRDPQPWREVVRRFIAAGRGLAAAHRIGLVHRDFKPDNVLVGGDGTVKVSDFGLVRSSAGLGVVRSELIEGTPAYMAPEQLAGGDVDARADQFALAVSIWEGVCGGRPFQPEPGTRDVLDGMLRAIRARRLMRSTRATVPGRVLRILERALEAEPAARWPSVEALVDALERATTGRARRFAIAGAAAAVIASGAIVALALATRPDPDPVAAGRAITQAVAPVYVAIGDLAASSEGGGSPRADWLPVAITAYDTAVKLTADRELRPKLARALYHSGECTAAVAQIDTYLREHGTEIYDEDVRNTVHVVPARAAGTKTRIDRTLLMDIRRECIDQTMLAQDPAHFETIADHHWRSGHTDEAIAALERAYAISKDPNLLLRMGDIRRSELACIEARRRYAAYLAAAPHISDDWRLNVQRRADTCGQDR